MAKKMEYAMSARTAGKNKVHMFDRGKLEAQQKMGYAVKAKFLCGSQAKDIAGSWAINDQSMIDYMAQHPEELCKNCFGS